MAELPEDIPIHNRILVVEDVEQLRNLWLRALTEMGLHATGVRSGEDALRLVEQYAFGVAMLDLNLPGISGIELFERLREKHPEIAVIIITGYGTLEAAQRAIHLGVVEFLTKPCGLGELEVALVRAQSRFKEGIQQRCEPIPPLVSLSDASLQEPPESAIPATMVEIERRTILEALDRNDGNRAATAKELGISVRTLFYRLAEYQRQGFLP